MSRSRAVILTDIVQIRSDLNSLNAELNEYPWDSEKGLIVIPKEDFIHVFNRAIAGEITFDTVEEWANIIECRDDVDYELHMMEDLIFELANPYLNGEINKAKLEEMINRLYTNKLK